MRGTKGFVDVEMTHVKAGFPCPGNTQKGVGVGLVIEAEGPCIVHYFDEFVHSRVIEADVFRVRHENGCRSFGDSGFQCFDVGETIFVGIKGNDFETCCSRGRRVTWVGENGSNDFITLV